MLSYDLNGKSSVNPQSTSTAITCTCGTGRRSPHSYHRLQGWPAQKHCTVDTAASHWSPGIYNMLMDF